MLARAVFLDLNGTLVEPVQVLSPADYQPIAVTAEAIKLLTRRGFICPVVTTQSRIQRGIYTEETFREWFRSFQSDLAAYGAIIEGPYLCPHRFAVSCYCKKPQPELYYRAARELGIDCARSYVVGDSPDDVRAACAIGAKGCFVLTGWGPSATSQCADEADYIGLDILDVARWIVRDSLSARVGRGGSRSQQRRI